MGRQESLTALALGRGHYEDEIIETAPESSRRIQQYNDRGYPRNSETKRREREHVRAANEVMQVTGVVEDSLAVKVKATQCVIDKNQETITGLRMMEAGRSVLVAGVWGVMGLRRRILLYRPYTAMGIVDSLKHERMTCSIPTMLFSGMPAVVAHHLIDWVSFFAETVLDAFFEERAEQSTLEDEQTKRVVHMIRDTCFTYVSLQLRLFAVLQQLYLIPSSSMLPNLMSFIPFSASSPLTAPPLPSMNRGSLLGFGAAWLQTLSPFLIILLHGKVKHALSRIIYRPIYKTLPRPTGDSMFSGLDISAPLMEYDTPDRPEDRPPHRSDEPTLRALEGLPPTSDRQNTADSSDEDEEVAHATLISFDVEATEAVETSAGAWSAELRSANEPRASGHLRYRVTGLTMLPPIMATEALREVIAGFLVLPLDAIMVRVVGRAYRVSAGLGLGDMYGIEPTIYAFGNILSVLTIQLAVTGTVWAGFTLGTQWWATRNREALAEEAANATAD